MIAVGTVGEGAITGALLGSVVLKLVQRSTLPLLVVPARSEPADGRAGARRALVAP